MPLTLSKDTTEVNIFLENTRDAGEVVVKSWYNLGLLWWKKFVANKHMNDPYRQESYSYELYNKVEADIDNFNRKKFERYKLLKPFGFILDNIESILQYMGGLNQRINSYDNYINSIDKFGVFGSFHFQF